MKQIKIFDTTLRDGEQSPRASLNKEEKIIIAQQLARMNIDIIEAGFPIASEDDFEAVKQIAQEIEGPIICGLSRLVKKDIDRSWEAVKYSKKPRIHVFIATSKVHREKKLKMTNDEIISNVKEMVSYAKSLCEDIEFSPEDAARTEEKYMIEVIKTAIEAGATTINVPDTVGYAQPEEFGLRIKNVFDKLGEMIKKNNVTISVHCHDDLGNAVANSLAAIKNGATQVEGCINGIGERAGNCAIEEIVMNLKTRKDYYDADTNVNTKEIFKTSRLVSKLTGIDVQRNKAIVGKNAFAHEAGIHQHGVIADRNTYEIMSMEDLGWEGENIVIGKHSGKHAIKQLLENEGYYLEDEKINEITTKVKDLADHQKEIMREDVIGIANSMTSSISEEEKRIKLKDVEITIHNKSGASAKVVLEVDGKIKHATCSGVGPVDAVTKTIIELVHPSFKLKSYKLKAITGGTDALADVSITVSDDEENEFKARAVDLDIVMASTYAIIEGMNKAFIKKRK
jgi:2-isopropylmalate synthase